MSNIEDIKVNHEEFHLCYECARFKHVDLMQKYDCSCCGGRKCLDLHTVATIEQCGFCGANNLCNYCLGFARCCHVVEDGKIYLRKDRSYIKIK